jgi:hypothetical protein
MRIIDQIRPTRRALMGGLAGVVSGFATPATPTIAQTRTAIATPPSGASTAAPAPAPGGTATSAFEQIQVSARRIDTFSRAGASKNFGRLTFRGGLVMTSDHSAFGGLSGIDIEADGKNIVMVSDQGHWLTCQLAYQGNAPSGLGDVRIGPIRGLGGRVLTKTRDQDAEACAILDGNLSRGTVLIAFERNHRIGRYPIIDRVIQPPTGFLKMPAEARQMKSNQGLEAVAVLRGGPLKGTVIGISERFPSADGHHVGWLWINGEPQRFGLANIGGFDITDVNSLVDGTVLILERRFRWTEGVKMQLRLVKPSELQPGALVQGEILLSADMGYDIDNMEGLGVHRTPKGETILTLISDDNFNTFLQRNILLQFALAM